jgi:hypothetical protein
MASGGRPGLPLRDFFANTNDRSATNIHRFIKVKLWRVAKKILAVLKNLGAASLRFSGYGF